MVKGYLEFSTLQSSSDLCKVKIKPVMSYTMSIMSIMSYELYNEYYEL